MITQSESENVYVENISNQALRTQKSLKYQEMLCMLAVQTGAWPRLLS